MLHRDMTAPQRAPPRFQRGAGGASRAAGAQALPLGRARREACLWHADRRQGCETVGGVQPPKVAAAASSRARRDRPARQPCAMRHCGRHRQQCRFPPALAGGHLRPWSSHGRPAAGRQPAMLPASPARQGVVGAPCRLMLSTDVNNKPTSCRRHADKMPTKA
jgi:hypothetical protein